MMMYENMYDGWGLYDKHTDKTETCPILYSVSPNAASPFAGRFCDVRDSAPDEAGEVRVHVGYDSGWIKFSDLVITVQHTFHNNGCRRSRCDVCGYMGNWDWRSQSFV